MKNWNQMTINVLIYAHGLIDVQRGISVKKIEFKAYHFPSVCQFFFQFLMMSVRHFDLDFVSYDTVRLYCKACKVTHHLISYSKDQHFQINKLYVQWMVPRFMIKMYKSPPTIIVLLSFSIHSLVNCSQTKSTCSLV